MPHKSGYFDNIIDVLLWPFFAISILIFAQFVLNWLSFILQLNLPDWLFEPVFNLFGRLTFRILHGIVLVGCIIVWIVKEWIQV